MKYVLTTEFTYQNEGEFKCKECGNIYTDEDAGKHLLSDFEY